MAAELVSSQFAKAIGIAVDTAIIDGSGTGEPTGIRNTVGVTSTPVDGQDGTELMDSVLKAAGRLAEDFITPDTLVVHPRDFVKFGLATDLQGRYLFDRGLSGQLEGSGITVVADANMAANLGVGLDETEMILGKLPGRRLLLQPDTACRRGVARRGLGHRRDRLPRCRAVRLRGRAPVRIRGADRHRAVGEGRNHDG